MKTEMEYWKELAVKAIINLRINYERTFEMLGDTDDELIDRKVKDKMMSELGIEDEEEYEDMLSGFPSAAYEVYVENNEPMEIFEVGVSGSFSGMFRVKAKTEDEARDYVADNLEVGECSMYLDDEDDMVDDFEDDNMGYEHEVEFVNDTGEVYEED